MLDIYYENSCETLRNCGTRRVLGVLLKGGLSAIGRVKLLGSAVRVS